MTENAGTHTDLEPSHSPTSPLNSSENGIDPWDLFFQTFNASPSQMALIHSDTGRYVEINSAFQQIMHYTRAEVIGKNSLELNLFIDLAERAKILQQLETQGYLRDERVRVRTKTGDIRQGTLFAQQITSRGQKLILLAFNDLTLHIETIRNLEESQARLNGFLNAAPDAMIILDSRGMIMLVNAQTERIFGYTQPELLGSSVEILMPEAMRSRHEANRASFVEKPRFMTTDSSRDFIALRKNGENFPVEISLSYQQIEQDEFFILCSVRDVTERKRSEKLGPVCKLRPKEDTGNRDHRGEVLTSFFIPGSYPAELLQSGEKPLHSVASPIHILVKGSFMALISLVRNGYCNAMLA